MNITPDMKLADVMKKFPASKAVLKKHIPACVTCGGATAESLERAARMNGIDPDLLVKELNRVVKPRKKK
jgi:hybrid cluster-associated redox disulfide protein